MCCILVSYCLLLILYVRFSCSYLQKSDLDWGSIVPQKTFGNAWRQVRL